MKEDSVQAFQRLKEGRGGFSRAQLAQWGVPWPPPKGWKSALLRGKPIPTVKPIERKEFDEELADLLREEKHLTARWYERISGQVPWKPGERERIDAKSDELSAQINRHIAEGNAEWFAGLPDGEL